MAGCVRMKTFPALVTHFRNDSVTSHTLCSYTSTHTHFLIFFIACLRPQIQALSIFPLRLADKSFTQNSLNLKFHEIKFSHEHTNLHLFGPKIVPEGRKR